MVRRWPCGPGTPVTCQGCAGAAARCSRAVAPEDVSARSGKSAGYPRRGRYPEAGGHVPRTPIGGTSRMIVSRRRARSHPGPISACRWSIRRMGPSMVSRARATLHRKMELCILLVWRIRLHSVRHLRYAKSRDPHARRTTPPAPSACTGNSRAQQAAGRPARQRRTPGGAPEYQAEIRAVPRGTRPTCLVTSTASRSRVRSRARAARRALRRRVQANAYEHLSTGSWPRRQPSPSDP